MNLFYIEVEQNGRAWLRDDEAKHAVRVLRKSAGDLLYGIDGRGNWYSAKILAMGKKEAELEIVERIEGWGEHDFEVVMAVSPLRLPDRFEWLVEKSVELGATRIVPLLCKRTVKPTIKKARLQRIMVSALKQCKRSRLPKLQSPLALEDWLPDAPEGPRLMGFCEAQTPLSELASEIQEAGTLSLLIGPEGDFTHEEVALAKENGFVPVSLGPGRLRTETAGIHLLSIIKFLKGW